jgi:hypothetical protein
MFIYSYRLTKCNPQSLASGRPSLFHSAEVDCNLCEDIEATTTPDGKVRESREYKVYHFNRSFLTFCFAAYHWRMRFAREVVGPISETLCLTRPIKYSEFLEFDRKVRDFDNPPLDLTENGVFNNKGHLWSLYKDIGMNFMNKKNAFEDLTTKCFTVLLFLHRNFFARAMIKFPDNPLRSPFSPSFLAAYSSSIKFLRTVRACFRHNARLLLGHWPVWVHALTSGVRYRIHPTKFKFMC